MATRSLLVALAVGAAFVLTLATSALADCRFYFAQQHDWGAKKGFYLNVEGAERNTLRLILGVADGNDWRFLAQVPPFQAGRRYEVKAVITPETAQLFLDGKLVGEQAGGFVPAPGNLEVNMTFPWSSDLGDYLMVQENLRAVASQGGKETHRLDLNFEKEAARPVALQFFERGAPRSLPFLVQAGETLTIETAFRCEGADLHAVSPLVDRYGQCKYADWPEKVRADEDLQADPAREERELAKMPPPKDRDLYGGWKGAGWSETGTGFFRTVRRGKFWWLLSPEGNPCFYVGVSSVPAQTWETTPVTGREFLYESLPSKEAPWAACWSRDQWGGNDGTEYCCYYTANLIRKYGDGWSDRATQQAFRRLAAWGFGGGKWGAPAKMVETPVLSGGATPGLAGHPDVFDEQVCATFRQEIEKQVAPRRADPYVLGWSFGNEYDQLIKRSEVQEVLKKPADVPAKRALVDYAVKELYHGSVEHTAAAWKTPAASAQDLYAVSPAPPAADIEKLRLYYEDRYYDLIYTALKAADPNHLYLGNWIVPGWWESEDDWRVHARHLDVIGYDRYDPEFADQRLQDLITEADKPILCGEFSYPAWYEGLRGYGRYGCYAKDEADSGVLYRKWTQDATRNPYCLGEIWFLYRDQPLTGRGPGRGALPALGEHFAFGLVTEQDRPKWDMIRTMRETNLAAAEWRFKASQGQ